MSHQRASSPLGLLSEMKLGSSMVIPRYGESYWIPSTLMTEVCKFWENFAADTSDKHTSANIHPDFSRTEVCYTCVSFAETYALLNSVAKDIWAICSSLELLSVSHLPWMLAGSVAWDFCAVMPSFQLDMFLSFKTMVTQYALVCMAMNLYKLVLKRMLNSIICVF